MFVGGIARVATRSQYIDHVIRTIVAAILLSVPFAFTRSLGAFGVIVALTIGAPLSVLAFVARSRDLQVIVRSYVFSLTGALVGSQFSPSVNAEPGDGIAAITSGAIVGWLVAAFRNQALLSRHATPDQERESAHEVNDAIDVHRHKV